MEPVQEESLPSSQSISISSSVSNSNKRVIDPWRQDGLLYDAYIEYLEKKDTLTNNERELRRTPPPRAPPPPEPGAEPPTYTYTFIIQNKSDDIDTKSRKISNSPAHLSRTFHPSKKSTKQKLPEISSHNKEQLKSLNSSATSYTKRISNSTNQDNHFASIQKALKRAEARLPTTVGLHPNNKITRTDKLFNTKFVNDHSQTTKLTGIHTKSLSNVPNRLKSCTESLNLSNNSKKQRMHSHTLHTNYDFNMKTTDRLQNRANNHHLQPTIHGYR